MWLEMISRPCESPHVRNPLRHTRSGWTATVFAKDRGPELPRRRLAHGGTDVHPVWRAVSLLLDVWLTSLRMDDGSQFKQVLEFPPRHGTLTGPGGGSSSRASVPLCRARPH